MMDWNSSSSSANENDANETNLNNTDFSNLNTTNYDTNLNLNYNQISQMISLNAGADLITSDGIINTNDTINANLTTSADTDGNIFISDLISQNQKTPDNDSTNQSSLQQQQQQQQQTQQALLNSVENVLKTTDSSATTMRLDDLKKDTVIAVELKASTVSSVVDTPPEDNHHHHLLQQTATSPTATNRPLTSASSSSLKKYNYKCKYCLHLTKFKAHIIEHMLTEHKINLMECPYAQCGRKFKDEWKLKRHLITNKEHSRLNEFRDLNDCIKQHVYVTPQKIGLYPCPLCQVDEITGNIFVLAAADQQTLVNNLINKNIDNSLYFNTYELLKDHLVSLHPAFNVDSYFICKQCGQVFLNRYKLSCHLFNVHSGKRKRRTRTSAGTVLSKLSAKAVYQHQSAVDEPETIDNIIDSVAKGLDTAVAKHHHHQATAANNHQLINYLLLNDKKYLCTVCKRKFRRVRDLQTHVSIMHKTISEQEKEQIKLEIDKTNQLLSSKKMKHLAALSRNNITKPELAQVGTKQLFVSSVQPASVSSTMLCNELFTKQCFICNKVFKMAASSAANADANMSILSLNKTFARHMQIQHGVNEKGEKLVDCPVCEKWFFNNKQMERHMRTHQVWIESPNVVSTSTSTATASADETFASDYKDKHSILYCHECIECGIFFKSIKSLGKHKLDTHKLRPVYRCALTDCARQFDLVDEFLQHAHVHCQKNIVCLKCKLTFTSKNSLRHHMKIYHYKTSISASTSSSSSSSYSPSAKKSLSTSVRRFADTKMSGDQAAVLSLVFPKAEENEAGKSATQASSEFMCATCGLDFQSKNSLHNHIATHNTSDLKLFMCSLCNSSFKTRKELSRHAVYHDYNKHKTCPECGETFKTSFHLKRHSLTRHSNIRPFKCNHCEMTFARKDKLKQHEAKHINHPLYKCSECDKGFYRKEHLKDHEISKHSKQYPFSCEHCNKGFVHAKDLHRHIRVRHLGATSSTSPTNSFSGNVTDTNQINNINNQPTVASYSTNTNVEQQQSSKQQQQQQQVAQFLAQNNNLTSFFLPSLAVAAASMSNPTLNAKTVNILNLKQEKQPKTAGTTTQASPTMANYTTTSTTNDFKSKKISSILKSNFYNTSHNNNNTNNNSNNAINTTTLATNNAGNFINNTPIAILTNNISTTKQVQPTVSEPILIDFNSNLAPIQLQASTFNNQQTPLLANNNGLIKLNSFKIKDQLLITDNQHQQQLQLQQQQQQQQQQHQQQQQQLQLQQHIQLQQQANFKAANSPIKNDLNNNYNNTINNILNNLKPFQQQPTIIQPQQQQQLAQPLAEAANDTAKSGKNTTSFYSCSHCQKSFASKATAKSHVENFHAEYVCPICHKSFKTKSHAQRHMDKLHADQLNTANNKPIKQDKVHAKLVDLSASAVAAQSTAATMTTAVPLNTANNLKNLNLISFNTLDAASTAGSGVNNLNNTNILLNQITLNANQNGSNVNFAANKSNEINNFLNTNSATTTTTNTNPNPNGNLNIINFNYPNLAWSNISTLSPISSAGAANSSHSPLTTNSMPMNHGLGNNTNPHAGSLFIITNQQQPHQAAATLLQQTQQHQHQLHQQQQNQQLLQQHQQQPHQLQKPIILNAINNQSNNSTTANYFLS